ncbi:hypothetical protein BDV38DRAFT_294590 [Aspergillus pseudotamarii]|uniref:Uncharacterized protein n=1 Tax=Aspergillus pseudotamarii TaxID=132259 RepID=A0A5N6SPC1_ASPPS|nr:uncharacterized protein BDV38DRAFT_294590 [Aspergillus pseudotamarii]KAE8135571.1 hypothetical protein BDV38DRAFT_294590 [Aspergillus pseudotamarii]
MAPKDKSKDKSLWSSIKALQAAAEDTINYSKSIKNHEELQQRNIELENELKAAHSKIEDHQRHLEEEHQKQQLLLHEKAGLGDYVEERVKGWVEKENDLLTQLQAARTQIEKTRQDAETRLDAKLQDLSRKVHDQTEQLRRLRTQLDERDTKITGLQGRLEQSQEEVEELKRATQLEEFGPDLIQNIKDLEAALRDIIQRYFHKAFPPDACEKKVIDTIQYLQWKECTTPNPFSMFPTPALSQSTTLRASCVQCMISNHLSRNIFRSTFVEASAGRMPKSDALDQCDQITSQEKALLRALLVKAFSSDERRQVEENIENVVSEVVNLVEPLLETECIEFKEDLRRFLQDAASLWSKVQRSSKWVTTVTNVPRSAEVWRSNKGKDTDLPEYPILVLFPHFITPGEPSPLHMGTMTWGDSESTRQDPSKWLDGERAMFNRLNAVVLREVPRHGRSFTEHLNARKGHDSQTRQSRASKDNSISRGSEGNARQTLH